jgi:membrane protease YdiL (CAAX protease family)
MQNAAIEANRKKAHEALIVWGLFFAATVTMNALVPIALGMNLHDWTYSNAKGLLLFLVNYAGFFLIVPLALTKGWRSFKKPSFIIPVAAAAVSVVLWYPLHYIATIAIIVYIYLHWRFDLSELGFRTKGWKGDVAAILIVGSLGILQALVSPSGLQIALLPAVYATAFRMFGNPASTVENLFYFGFLTERIGKQWNRYAVSFLIGAMYTAHEISNPEYWYEGMQFALVYIGVVVFAAIYLWRRSIVVTWLSDGFRWFLSSLL